MMPANSGKSARALQQLVGVDDLHQLPLVSPIAAIAIRMVTPNQFRIALPKRGPVGVTLKAKHTKRMSFLGREAVDALPTSLRPEPRGNGVKRIGEISPRRACVGAIGGEGAGRPLPSGDRRLGRLDLLRAHALEEVIASVVRADMFKAQPAPRPRSIEIAGCERRPKLAGLAAAGLGAVRLRALHPSVPFARLHSHRPYIGAMSTTATGPVAREMIERLTAALNPSRLDLEDQSHQHIGHAGHDPRGESHFALTIESTAFAGLSRVERQRRVYAALGDLMRERVHALTIRALAPEEG